MIIKIQIEEQNYLLYDEERTFVIKEPLSRFIKGIMRGLTKRYFEAKFIDGDVSIGKPLPNQKW